MKERHQPLYFDRQRTIVLTFETPEDAQAWDDAGRPLDALDVMPTAEVA